MTKEIRVRTFTDRILDAQLLGMPQKDLREAGYIGHLLNLASVKFLYEAAALLHVPPEKGYNMLKSDLRTYCWNLLFDRLNAGSLRALEDMKGERE